jgi:hypothetical protein
MVHADDPGFSLGAPERKPGIHGSPTREICFDECRIPADRLIGAQGTRFRTALMALDHTRLAVGAQAVGIAQGALDVTTGCLQQRRQFGKALTGFQGLQFVLADMATRTEAARLLVHSAAGKADRHAADLTFTSSAAKCFAGDTAMSVTTDAVHMLGGYGYTRELPVERMMRDAKITQIYQGTNQIQRMVMARQLLRPTNGRGGSTGVLTGP